jgi:hypothetical protein
LLGGRVLTVVSIVSRGEIFTSCTVLINLKSGANITLLLLIVRCEKPAMLHPAMKKSKEKNFSFIGISFVFDLSQKSSKAGSHTSPKGRN